MILIIIVTKINDNFSHADYCDVYHILPLKNRINKNHIFLLRLNYTP